MPYQSQIIPDSLWGIPEKDLLPYYDNPKNFHIPDIGLREIKDLEPNSFPKHAIVLLTHGLFTINSRDRIAVVNQIEQTKQEQYDIIDDRRTTKKQAYRLLRNFSDFWTRKVAKYMFTLSWDEWYWTNNSFINRSGSPYPENVIIPWSPRIKWDPNRSADAKDFKRETDFNGIKLIPRENQLKDQVGNKDHWKYHMSIEDRVADVESSYWWSIVFDIHDTWVRKQDIFTDNDFFRPWWYPEMEIGTLDGDSCNPVILEYFAEQVEKYFGFIPVINEQDKGGYVTQLHWWEERENRVISEEEPRVVNAMQIELGRYLYMKESTQEIDHDQARKVWAALRMCIQKTCEKFWEEYFANLD